MKAVSAKAAAAAGAAIGKGAILTMTITKTKAALVCAAALLLVTGGTVAVSHYVGRGHDEAIVMRDPAPGTAAITAVVATQPAYNGPPIVGYARLPDGTPVAGAAVFMSTPDHYLDVYDTENLREPHLMSGVVTTTIEGSTSITSKRIVGPMDIPAPVEATTGPDGRFAFQPTQVPAGLLVRGTMGMGIATAADVQSGRPVVVKPWARIEGVNRIGTQPLAGASNWSVWAINVDDVAVLNTANVRIFATATPDQSGRFVIGRLMAGPTFVQRMFSLQGGQVYLGRGGKIEFSKFPRGIWLSQVIDLAPAQTTVVKIGGTGWPITGRVKQPVSEFTFRRGVLSTNPPLDSENSYPIDFAPDGTFRVNDMPAGKYHLHGDFAVAAAGRGQAMTYRALNYVASADIDFVIPPMSGGRSDEPLDVGEIPLKPLPQLTIGKPAPDLALRMLDGSPRRLSDFRRKYVLLQIWTEGRRYLQREQLRLRAIHDRIDKDARFALLGVNVDALPREACKKALESGVRWPQAMLADPDRALPEEYRNSGSSLYLLDPQGNVLAKDLDEITAYEAVEQVLGNRKATDAVVRVEREPGASADAQTAYRDVPAPGPDTVSASALVTIVDGAPDGNSGQPHRLIDGRMPSVPDSPSQSFFFNTGTLEGRFRLDLPQLTSIQQINTYSWHTGTRAPQVYRVYGSDGSSKSLDPAPKIGTDPTTCGWTLIASVDTRPAKGTMGGRYAASIAAPKGTLGAYRQLLFVVFPTETNDEWGNTLYGEINVIGAP
jgi:peroxiredoxin